MLEVSF